MSSITQRKNTSYLRAPLAVVCRLLGSAWVILVLTLIVTVLWAVGASDIIKFFDTPNENIALLRPTVSVSSTAPGSSASYALDGDNNTYWTSSGGGEQTIGVDLGDIYHINNIKLKWGQAYASSYAVETSNDAIAWPPLYSITNGTGFENLNIGRDPRSYARYVRIAATDGEDCTKYELVSFEVYPGNPIPTQTTIPQQ